MRPSPPVSWLPQALLLALCAGCAAPAEIVELSSGLYRTNTSTRVASLKTDADIRADDIKRARVFCNSRGQQPRVITAEPGTPSGVLNAQSSTLTFACE